MRHKKPRPRRDRDFGVTVSRRESRLRRSRPRLYSPEKFRHEVSDRSATQKIYTPRLQQESPNELRPRASICSQSCEGPFPFPPLSLSSFPFLPCPSPPFPSPPLLCRETAPSNTASCIVQAPRHNFWVGQICGLRPTFYKRSMAFNSQHWDWGQTEILCDVCTIQ